MFQCFIASLLLSARNAIETNVSLPLTAPRAKEINSSPQTKKFRRVFAALIRFRELTFIRHCIAYCFLPPAYSSIFSLTHPSVGTRACRNNRFCDRIDGKPCALFQNRKPLAKTNICPHLWRRILCLPLLRPIKRVHCDIQINIIRISNLSWRIPTRLVGFTLGSTYKSPETQFTNG